MPLVKFFVIVILLACMHSCGKYPADGGSADTDKLYAEGMAELKENQYNKALSKLLRYVQIEERNSRKDTLNLMKTYYNVGGIYSIYSDFAQALELYKKGYALGQASDNDEMQFKFLTNMIGASCYISKPELADGLNENLLRLKGISKGRRMYYYYFNKGFIAGSHGDYDGKARWMEKAIAAADRYGLPDDMKVYAYSEVYQCYENRGDLYKALSALKTYESIACDMNQMYLYTDCYKGLMRIYTKLGDKENALHYQKKYFRYNDSLLNINEFSRIKTDYEVSEDKIVQATIDNLEKINSLQKIVLSMLLALVALAVTATIVFYRQRQKLHVANLALFKRNAELLKMEIALKNGDAQGGIMPPTDIDGATADKDAATYDRNDLIRRITEVMSDEDVFCDPAFSLSALARLTESNTNYVSQAINSNFGKNFRTYLNEYRIKVAMKRMMDTDRFGNYSIHGIAESVGFKSDSNFISAFRKVTGMTPSLYQKLSKDDSLISNS